jgi:hypothetical protein
MPRTSKIIRIPRPAPGSFNKNRRAGALLRSQVVHLQKALVKHHAEIVELLAIDMNEIRTEGEVSEYARKVTRVLHQRSGSKPAK